MKKILLTLLAVIFALSLTGRAWAGDPKAPKSICFSARGDQLQYFSFATKSAGSIKFAENQTVKFYDVQGNFFIYRISNRYSCPIDGSGYMKGENFVFHFTGVFSADSSPVNISGEGLINVVTGTGAMYFIMGDGDDTLILEAGPCTEFQRP